MAPVNENLFERVLVFASILASIRIGYNVFTCTYNLYVAGPTSVGTFNLFRDNCSGDVLLFTTSTGSTRDVVGVKHLTGRWVDSRTCT